MPIAHHTDLPKHEHPYEHAPNGAAFMLCNRYFLPGEHHCLHIVSRDVTEAIIKWCKFHSGLFSILILNTCRLASDSFP